MKFFDTDTHEIFEASAAEFEQYMELYHESIRRDTILLGNTPHIFVPTCPPLRGHRHFVYKLAEEYTMIKFEDKFVHFRWSEELKGKKCFVADDMEDLELAFTKGETYDVGERKSSAFPFSANDSYYRFAYYDPNYDCKVAYNEGKKIQFKYKKDEWRDAKCPEWLDDFEYRIKPDDTYAVVIAEGRLSYVHTKNITCQHVFFRGSQDECHNYIVSHAKFTECMIAYLDNKRLQRRIFAGCDWKDIDNPTWNTECEYRIKPGLTWTDLKLGDTVRQFNGYIASMVTAFDATKDVSSHVQLSGWGWTSDEELAEKWYKL